MTIERKLLSTSPSGGATDVADVFSTTVYTGNSSTQPIVNGIDLSGEGGLVWLKWRSGINAFGHALYDSERGITKQLQSQTTAGETTQNRISSFNSSGFTLTNNTETNYSNEKYASWTFRKKKKFFDVVTYSGNSTAGHTVSHNLGSAPAMMIIKQTNGTNNWFIYHKNVNKEGSGTAQNTAMFFMADGGDTKVGYFNNTAPTDSVFTLGSYGGDWGINGSGENYVAYLFADNSAEDADDQMIKCGSYTGNNSVVGPYVSLGWEAQFILVKSIGTDDWSMWDTMRGLPEGTGHSNAKPYLNPGSSSGDSGTNSGLSVDADGFHVTGVGGQTNDSGVTYIYMAIRAPMMVEPEAATEVYKGDYWNNSTPYTINTGFTTDLLVYTRNIEAGSNHWFVDRLRGEKKRIDFSATTAESTWTHTKLDVSNGYTGTLAANGGNKNLTYAFSRAKGCFDILNYTGNSSSSQNVPHQLGVIPEFVINVQRDTGYKYVVSTAIGTDVMVGFNDQGSLDPRDPNDFFDTPTDTLLKPLDVVNSNGKSYINYLFATLAGVSKCGKYIGNGSSQTIDCGFAAGARFIMLKCVSVGSNQGVNTTAWYVWDSARGIVSGNDPYFKLNTASAMVSNTDSIDPTSSGFIVNQNSTTEINNTGRTYIYLAIA